jgi:hypothetical protein
MPIGRLRGDYSILPDQARNVMNALIETSRETGHDYVPQSWVRDRGAHITTGLDSPVAVSLMNDLVKWGYLKTSFTSGPVYEIIKWPLEQEENNIKG